MSEVATIPELELLAPDPRAGNYVVFRLAHGEFGVAVHKVREVMETPEITVVPNAPAFIAGVMNLRGKVIPVVDLRRTFELPGEQPTAHPCILIVRAALASVDQVLGIVVDEVLEVLSLKTEDFLGSDDFQAISEFGSRNPAPYVVGAARAGGKVKLLLDIDEVLNNLDLTPVAAMPAAA